MSREGILVYSTVAHLLCFVFPVLKPYCWGCHDSEFQLVTVGTCRSPRHCSPHFTLVNSIGPGNYGFETGQEISRHSCWIFWNFHSIISPNVCLLCFPRSLIPTSLMFFSSSVLMPVFYAFIVIVTVISLKCVSYLKHAEYFNTYDIWLMHIQ